MKRRDFLRIGSAGVATGVLAPGVYGHEDSMGPGVAVPLPNANDTPIDSEQAKLMVTIRISDLREGGPVDYQYKMFLTDEGINMVKNKDHEGAYLFMWDYLKRVFLRTSHKMAWACGQKDARWWDSGRKGGWAER